MIHYDTDILFRQYAKPGDLVCALGDDVMNLEHVQGPKATKHYKQFKMTSVDWNGTADVSEDLSKPVKNPFLSDFDIVTDFGTGEHVGSLYHFLKNAFGFLKVGGIAIHANPKTGHFPGHQLEGQKHESHHFIPEFWSAYAKAAKLELVEARDQAAYGNTETGVEVYAVYRKTENSKFPTKAAFTKIMKAYVFSK